MAFCFLVNINHCFNMNIYLPFFYKKMHEGKMYVYEDSSLEASGQSISFGQVASDIQIQLDCKREIGEYQIAIAFREESGQKAWRESILSKLLCIDYELRKVGIILNAGQSLQSAVNVFCIYEANTVDTIVQYKDDYYASDTFTADVNLLLREMNLEASLTKADIKRAINSNYDDVRKNAAAEFLKSILSRYDEKENINIVKELQDRLRGYQVFQILVNNQNRNIEDELLKIVEYVNEDFYNQDLMKITSLSDRCKHVWGEVSNRNIRERYAGMLYEYKRCLSDGLPSDLSYNNKKGLDEFRLPEEKEISLKTEQYDLLECEEELSSEDRKNFLIALLEDSQDNPEELLETFKRNIRNDDTLDDLWENTYKNIKVIIDSLDKSLEHYSTELSGKYSEKLGERKEEYRRIDLNEYFVNVSEEQKKITSIEKEKRQIMEKLDQPQMSPSMQYSDSLNTRNVLDRENNKINHYIICLRSVTTSTFAILLLVLAVITMLLYSLGQFYVFTEFQSFLVFIGYVVFSILFMSLMYGQLFSFYRRKIVKSINSIKEEMRIYIDGYFAGARKFHEHINCLNQLDYIEQQLAVRKKLVEQMTNLEILLQWHEGQIEEHLRKVGFFEGIIATRRGNDATEKKPIDYSSLKNASNDVSDCELYWPQKT